MNDETLVIKEGVDNNAPEKMIPESQLEDFIQAKVDKMFEDKVAQEKHKRETKKRYEAEKLKEYSESKKEDDEPWIAVIGESTDENGQVAFEMDWNDAMIRQLRDEGVPGITDDEVVNTYLAALFKYVVGDDIQENPLDNNLEERVDA